jgi:hypothetical protein
MKNYDNISETIIALEKAALERWGKGDPSGFLEISAQDVVYFDPFVKKRLDGIEALKNYYEGARGKIRIERFELLNPRVQIYSSIAVLTFNYASYGGESVSRWNCTEVYCFREKRWQIIQTHWSFTAT